MMAILSSSTIYATIKLAFKINALVIFFFWIFLPLHIIYSIFFVVPAFIILRTFECISAFWAIAKAFQDSLTLSRAVCSALAECIAVCKSLEYYVHYFENIRIKIRSQTPSEFINFIKKTISEVCYSIYWTNISF